MLKLFLIQTIRHTYEHIYNIHRLFRYCPWHESNHYMGFFLLLFLCYYLVYAHAHIGHHENHKGEKGTVEKENCNRFYADPIESMFNGLRTGVRVHRFCRLLLQVTNYINNYTHSSFM